MKATLPPLPALAIGRYRHYKGQEYEIFALCRHSETEEVLVFYRPLYGDSGWWVRPYDMFTGTLEVDGEVKKRFEYIG